MCAGRATGLFRRLKKPVCTAENHGLQTGYYLQNSFFAAAFTAACIHCEKGNFNFPLAFLQWARITLQQHGLRAAYFPSQKR